MIPTAQQSNARIRKRRLLKSSRWGEMAKIASIMAAARATVLLFNKDISISQLLVRFLWNIEMWVHNDGAARVSIGGRENIKYLVHAPCHVSKKKTMILLQTPWGWYEVEASILYGSLISVCPTRKSNTWATDIKWDFDSTIVNF